ncbi:hypothetical protein DFQ27_007153 [Actinomortierella ambigua]|uniref:HIT domain-containing protein n=1 Tax=Actinomortierella ambigua TaxID=1343610 RepID=A0A9P6PVR7_9FUNG|nr:hypothetical protein DFQ27_007153 [Actinomortierella ambigua]
MAQDPAIQKQASTPTADTSTPTTSASKDNAGDIQALPPSPNSQGRWLTSKGLGSTDDLEEFYQRRGVGAGQKGRPFKGRPTDALLAYCQYPEDIEQEFMYYYDERVLVINDAYPKSKYHFLVLPRKRILYLTDLRGEEGIQTVKELFGRALWLVDRLKVNDASYEYKYGFHVRQSMSQIHLHVLSTDYSTARMKRKEHWNSFTTEFFISPAYVLQILRERGRFQLSDQERERFEAIVSQNLQCPVCKTVGRNMPDIKRHYLQTHWQPRHLELQRHGKEAK